MLRYLSWFFVITTVFTYYHSRIIEVLIEPDPLPEVIPSTSGDTTVAAMVGTRTSEEELEHLLFPDCSLQRSVHE